MSYAWLLPPICDPHDGHLLLDGCYTDNVPGKAMKSTGVKYILVLDVAAVDDRELTNFGDTLSGWWALFNNLNPFGCKVKIPNQTDIQLRLAFCSHYRNLEELKRDPKYEYIHPELGSYTSSDVSGFF
jgi:lysophospholipid hydrolase